MTNYGLEQHLIDQGKTLVRTRVGDKYVSAHLEKNNLLLGGETAGHIIMRNYLPAGDGIFVALKTLETIIATNNWEMNSFHKIPQCIINVPVAQKKDLEQDPYATVIESHKAQLTNGRIVVRYSGTENLLRVMVEDESLAEAIARNLSGELQEMLEPHVLEPSPA